MKLKFTILFFSLIIFINVFAQEQDMRLVQFSGIIVRSPDLKPVSFTSIIIKGTNRGTISDYNGFFSFVAKPNEIIEFSAVGFKKEHFRIPDTIVNNRYSLIQVMTVDTIMLKTTVIYPWPTYEQFKQIFTKIKIPDDDLERARKNLELQAMKQKMQEMPMSASANYRNYIQQQTNKLYYSGQLPPNNLLNPLAWAKFIQAWKNGDLFRK
ncbi:MAG: carboxypeptidase-like regulatory domain-containing protein [Bacteroidales bacterium]|nr:carboxypeptidase-like regulatory domain-containing protein [Bacteroidales bacterium]